MFRRLVPAALALLAACGPARDFDAERLDSVEDGLRVAVPARIEAEAYERAEESTPENTGRHCDRGDGVDMEIATDPNGGGCNVGWTAPGEALEYDVSVTSESYFRVVARVASAVRDRRFLLELDGEELTSLTAPSNGWQAWEDRSSPTVHLLPGDHTVRVYFETGEVNLNYLLVEEQPSCSDGLKNGDEAGVDCGGACPACSTGCVEQLLPLVGASASSLENDSLPAALAIDGNAATRWSSAFSDPQWLTIDLGTEHQVSRVVLNWEVAASASYEIQIQDPVTASWSTLYATTSGDGGVDDLTGLSGVGRFVRMYSHARTTGWGNSLWEVSVYGDPNPSCSSTSQPSCSDGETNGGETGVDCGGPCPPCSSSCVETAFSPVSASASSQENASLSPALAIDGNPGTRWASAFSDPQWLTVDLGSEREVRRVVLNWETAASASYEIQIQSPVTGAWSTLYATTAGDGGVDDLSGLSGVGRFVRMYSHARTTGWGNSLWELTVYGCADESSDGDSDGDRLLDSVESGTGVFIGPTNTGTSPTNPDTDGDGLPDGDEVLGTTAGLDLPGMGSNPLRKNILLEYDWFEDSLDCGFHSHRPNAALLDRLSTSFANAPVSNPDGSRGITIINDYGQGGLFSGGNRIDDADGVVDGFGSEYYAYKAANFSPNRQGYFHYVVMPHQYGSRDNYSSGLAYIVGEDMIVSLYCANSDDNVGNTIMHELGHNLGLHHGGPNDATNYKPNYASVMNYSYQFPGVDTDCRAGGDGVLDYSRKVHHDLDELALSESAGVCGGVAWDFDYDGFIEENVVYDVNGDGFMSVLRDHDDWGSLVYDFAPSFGAGASARMSVVRKVVSCDSVPLWP